MDENPFNPRQEYPEKELLELAASMKSMGVIQPVLIRPADEGRYQVIVGWRRKNAAELGGIEELPAIVREDISDALAEKLAIAENTHRVQLNPFEESTAILKLIEERKYSLDEVSAQFGWSKPYIANRMKLKDLISPVAKLLREDAISLGIALEFCKYEKDIQNDVYKAHFSDPNQHDTWRAMTVKEFRRILFERYTDNIDRYNFCKEECATCGNNTGVNLFHEQEEFKSVARCQFKQCLLKKNNDFVFDKAHNILITEPDTRVIVAPGLTDYTAAERLQDMGYEVFKIDDLSAMFLPPQPPQEVSRDDYEDDESYDDAVALYHERYELHKDEMNAFHGDLASGNLDKYAIIDDRDVYFLYAVKEQVVYEEQPEGESTALAVTGDTSTEGANEPTLADINGRKIQTFEAKKKEIREKIEKDKRAKQEGILKDVRTIVQSVKFSGNDITKEEKEAMNFALYHYANPQSFIQLGASKKDEELDTGTMAKLARRVTPKRANILVRDFIRSFFTSARIKDGVALEFMVAFAALHSGEECSKVVERHEKTFDSRIGAKNKEIEEIDKQIEKLNQEIEMEREALEAVPEQIALPESTVDTVTGVEDIPHEDVSDVAESTEEIPGEDLTGPADDTLTDDTPQVVEPTEEVISEESEVTEKLSGDSEPVEVKVIDTGVKKSGTKGRKGRARKQPVKKDIIITAQ